MPQIQVLPKGTPGFGEMIGQALGNIGTGFQTGMQMSLQNYLKRKSSAADFDPYYDSVIKREGYLDLDRGLREEGRLFGRELTNAGMDKQRAANYTLDYLDKLKKDPTGAAELRELLTGKKSKTGEKTSKEATEASERLKEEGKEIEEKEDKSFAKKYGFKGQGFKKTLDELGLLPGERPPPLKGRQDIPKVQSLLNALGQGVTEGGQMYDPGQFSPFTQRFSGGRFGQVERSKEDDLRALAQLHEEEIPANAGDLEQKAKRGAKIFTQTAPLAAAFGGTAPIMALEAGAAGFLGEEARKAGFSHGGQGVAEGVGLSLPTIAKGAWNLIKRIPGAAKEVATAAKVAGVAEEEVVAQAAQNLEAEGVDISKAAQGDPQTIKAIKDETTKVAKTFQGAAKFSEKEAAKVRDEVAKKLPESPLERYYAPEKKVASRPATVAKETERLGALNEKLGIQKMNLKNSQFRVLEGENLLRSGKYAPQSEEAARIQSGIDAARQQHEKTLNEIRKIEFEKKYKIPPKTSEEIEKGIKESFTELKKAIDDPTAAKFVKVREQLEKDKEIIFEAQRLAARGEIPGEKVQDQFIKIHEKYNEAYKELADELKDFIKTSDDAVKIKNASELLKTVQESHQAGKAQIIRQIDKRRAVGVLERPSGAFYKQQLKELRKDVEAFQKDFFRYGHLKNPAEMKAHVQAKKINRQVPPEGTKAPHTESTKAEAPKAEAKEGPKAQQEQAKQAKEDLKNPKGENKTLGEALNEEAKAYGKAAEAGTATASQEQKLGNKATEWIMRNYGPLLKSTPRGIIGGVVQAIIEETTGLNIPYGVAGGLIGLPGKGGIATRTARGGISSYIASWVHRGIRHGMNHFYANKLNENKNSIPDYKQYRNHLASKYSVQRANEIKAIADEKRYGK